MRVVAPGIRLIPCEHDSATVRSLAIEFLVNRMDDTVLVLHFTLGDESALVDDDSAARGEVIEAQVYHQPACLGGNGGTHRIVDEEAARTEKSLLGDEPGREVTHSRQGHGTESVKQVRVSHDAAPERVIDAMLANASSDKPTLDRAIAHVVSRGSPLVQESESSPSFLNSASSAARALSSLDVPVVDASAGGSSASPPNSASNC